MEMLQEHVTCPVCLDVFDDPHSLECRHIVCLPCLNRLKDRGKVECPECREQMPFKKVKLDFKMAKLVENFKKEKEAEPKDGIPDRQPKGCEVCKIPRKAVVSRCKTCDAYLCQSCDLAHKGVRATKNHILESKAEIILAVQDKAKRFLENSKQDLEKVEQNLSDIFASIALINEKKSTQQVELNVCIDRLMHQLENHRVKLKNDLIKGNDSTLETLTQNKQVFENHKALLQGSIGCLTKLSTSNDLETLMGPTVTDNLPEQSKKIEVDIFQLEGNIQDSPVKLVNGPGFNVTVHNINASYNDLVEAKCVQVERFCEDDILNMIMINNELWCCGSHKIEIIGLEDLELTHDKIQNSRGLTKGLNGDVFVACAESFGLLQLNSENTVVKKILKGSFSDVCYYNQHLYALDYDQKKVYVLGKVDSQWNKKTEWEVGATRTMNNDTKMFVNRHGVFISSTEDERMYQLSHKGDLMQTAGMYSDDYENSAGILGCPFFCDVDSKGTAIVADYHNDSLNLYNSTSCSWQIIHSLKDIEQPRSVILDGSDLFISTPSELLKYRVDIE